VTFFQYVDDNARGLPQRLLMSSLHYIMNQDKTTAASAMLPTLDPYACAAALDVVVAAAEPDACVDAIRDEEAKP